MENAELIFQKEFDARIKKVCHYKKLREYAHDFFADLCSKYKGISFSKNDFETLIFDNKEIKQDMVINLFKHKDKVTINEILLYFASNNLNRINIFLSLDNSHTGYYNAGDKIIGLKKVSLLRFLGDEFKSTRKKYVQSILEDFDIGLNDQGVIDKKATKLKLKQAKQSARHQRDEHYKHVLYHELCHLLELRTFMDRKVLRNKMSDMSLVNDDGKSIVCEQGVIDKSTLQEAKLQNERILNNSNLSLVDKFFNIKKDGVIAISEIINEKLTLNILGKENTQDDKVSKSIYYKKKSLAGRCVYNSDYDVAILISALTYGCNSMDYRFNQSKVLDELKDLKISNNHMDNIKDTLIRILKTATFSDFDKQDILQVKSHIGSLKTYDLLNVMMGFVVKLRQSNFHGVNNRAIDETKILIQRLLLECLKNKTTERLADDSFTKDKYYFRSLNATFEGIDNTILYKKGYTPVYQLSGDSTNHTKIDADDIDVLPLKELAKKNGEQENVALFYDIDKLFRKYIKQEGIEELETIMPFYINQTKLKNRYKIILESRNLFESERKKASMEYINNIYSLVGTSENRNKRSEKNERSEALKSMDWLR